jgi:hypothetical protein
MTPLPRPYAALSTKHYSRHKHDINPPPQQQIEMFLINRGLGNVPTYKSCIHLERFPRTCQSPPTPPPMYQSWIRMERFPNQQHPQDPQVQNQESSEILRLIGYTSPCCPHPPAYIVPPCCIVGVREGVIAPFLASVTDNCFKTICQIKWINSITLPQSESIIPTTSERYSASLC